MCNNKWNILQLLHKTQHTYIADLMHHKYNNNIQKSKASQYIRYFIQPYLKILLHINNNSTTMQYKESKEPNRCNFESTKHNNYFKLNKHKK